jgi:hemoglobin-like flavoprotein
MSLTERQIQLVEESFAAVRPIAEQAAKLFYDRLFAIDPAVRALFKRSDMNDQGNKLMQTLGVAVGMLRKPGELVPVLQQLGARHAGYGVKKFDYETVGAAFLWTLEQGLGAAFTDEVREAWAATYGIVADVMSQAGRAAEAAGPAAAPPA